MAVDQPVEHVRLDKSAAAGTALVLRIVVAANVEMTVVVEILVGLVRTVKLAKTEFVLELGSEHAVRGFVGTTELGVPVVLALLG